MTQLEWEARQLETRLADLRHNFDDSAGPILNRLEQIRLSTHSSDRNLLIPKQALTKAPENRIPKQF